MMPQKKNPDVLELIRGKTGRVYGAWVTLLTVLKGLPLSYNRDLQEDKEPLFDTVDTLRSALRLMAELVQQASFQKERMAAATREGFLLATDLADYLVRKGLPFRQAHKVVGQIVQRSLESGRPAEDWTLAELQAFSTLFDRDVADCFSTARSLEKKGGVGGTAPASVAAEIRKIQRRLKG